MRRRTVIGLGAAAVGLGALAVGRNGIARWALTRDGSGDVQLTTAPGIDSPMCVLTPTQTEGPYFVKSPQRRDIREGRPGLPLDLRLRVVSASDCQPLTGAVVEVWHCDTSGAYSGHPAELARKPFDTLLYAGRGGGNVPPTNDETFLRGSQVTGQDGSVHFSTILPGWYEPRVPHIHVQVLVEGIGRLTTQLYFDDAFTAGVYGEHADYKPFGLSPYNRRNDLVLGRQSDGRGLMLVPTPRGDTIQASALLGLA